MRKIDLHIHTKPTKWDAEFTFSLDTLADYVEKNDIDCIAVTNHNCFDAEQFKDISDALNIVTLPGIEITLGPNKGHMLLISDNDEIEDFNRKCQRIGEYVKELDDSIDVVILQNVFGDLSRYLLIPHYDKEPNIEKKILLELSSFIEAGEVSSVKKFIYKYKDQDSLTPVLFGDLRAKECLYAYPSRQTFIDLDEINITSLKLCLSDRTKVSLSRDAGHKLFQVLPNGLEISTGLNVIIGGRSSGKSYTLDEINKHHEKVKYIRQFELLEKDPKKDKEKFDSRQKSTQASVADEFLNEFRLVISDVSKISLESDERSIEQFIDSLITYATETEKADSFSKCKLFSESPFQDEDLRNLQKLISAVETIIDSLEYRAIVEAHINRRDLIALHKKLIEKYVITQQHILKRRWVNSVITSIRNDLQSKTSAPRVEEVDLSTVQRNRMRVRQFERIAKEIIKPRTFHKDELQNFSIVGRLLPFSGARELKEQSHSQMAFSEAFSEYERPYRFLKELQKIPGLDSSTYYQYFAKVDFQTLNQYGYPVSGGERAEFNLLQEIQDALQNDMLLIDEPESSFDNLFLKDHVNALIKSIAKNMPVVIVTHNNTVGASIQPDYLVFTQREVDQDGPHFRVYSGYPSSDTLSDLNGNQIKNQLVLLDCLEAGLDAYRERGRQYKISSD